MAKNCLSVPGLCGGEIASIPLYSNLLAQINDAIAKGQQHRIRTMASRDQVIAIAITTATTTNTSIKTPINTNTPRASQP
jgi:hypothetical protein